MTEAAGPLEPEGRFSSLPIFGPEVIAAACLDSSELRAGCDMAQAFDIPLWETESGQRTLARRSSQNRASQPKSDPVRGPRLGIWVSHRLSASAPWSKPWRQDERVDSRPDDRP